MAGNTTLNPVIIILLLITSGFSNHLSAAALNQPDPVAIYLTWQQNPHTTMTVHWITESRPGASNVYYRPYGEAGWSVATGKSQIAAHLSEWVNTVEITGLDSDRIYNYMIKEGQILSFRTMPARLNRYLHRYHDG